MAAPAVFRTGRIYDLAPDGQRFMLIQERGGGEPSAEANLIVMQNWPEQLKYLVPTGR